MKIINLPKRIGQLLIICYQRTLSFDHGPLAKFVDFQVCRFHPTCSEYGYQALEKYGLIKGSWLTLKRILRCNPWTLGGHDSVP